MGKFPCYNLLSHLENLKNIHCFPSAYETRTYFFIIIPLAIIVALFCLTQRRKYGKIRTDNTDAE